MKIFGLVGTGGFGREVMPVAREALRRAWDKEGVEVVFLDADHRVGATINGTRVISESQFLESKAEIKLFNVAVADHSIRRRVAEKLVMAGCKPFSIHAPNVVFGEENLMGEGAILCPFVTVTSNTKIGCYFHANIYSYIAHDCIIGDFVTFAPGVHCNGNVVVDDCAYVGTGAVIRNGSEGSPVTIGKGAIVGMGAVVTKDVAPFTTVVGNPAAVLQRDSSSS